MLLKHVLSWVKEDLTSMHTEVIKIAQYVICILDLFHRAKIITIYIGRQMKEARDPPSLLVG